MHLVRSLILGAGLFLGAMNLAPTAHAGAAVPARGIVDDEVIFWNNILLDRFRQDFGTGCPCPLARAGAIVQAAVYEAVNSIEREYEPYLEYVEVEGEASKEAAVCAAAYRTMLSLFPGAASELRSAYNQRKGLIPDGPVKFEGIRVGNRAAKLLLDNRRNDGSDLPETYTFNTAPGFYAPPPPNFSRECNPQWAGRVPPFTMVSPTQFRPLGPCGFRSMVRLLRSPQYAEQLNEVRTLGSRNSTIRTDEQTRIAFFWANDRNGTYKPPGHLFSITQTVSRDQGLNLNQNARLFALVGLAMADAGIVAWDAKYSTAIDLWRPVTAIRRAHLDNNPLTPREPTWLPLNEFTPPFPAWISGHATFGAAHAAVMAGFFGTDNITFTVDSEDPYYNALPSHPPRTFTSFSQAAVENGASRIYLGVHFRMDATDGNAAGFALGNYVARNFLKKRCFADYNADGVTDSNDFMAFYADYATGDLDADVDNNNTVDQNDLNEYMHAYLNGC